MEINFVQLIFTLQLDADTPDRYAFFGIRPHFTDFFRARSGCKREGDEPCSGEEELCPYHRIFSQPLSADPAALKRFQKPPLPFVFDIPILPPVPNRGRMIELGLTLAGSATHQVADFFGALKAMLSSSTFRRIAAVSLIKVESKGYHGQRTPVIEQGKVFSTDLLATISLQGLRETAVLAPDVVTVTILTPMRIMSEGTARREISFSPFIRALFRRVSSIAYYYGGCDDRHDYKWLAEQSHLVESADTGLLWVDWGCRRSGLTGTVTFRGGNLTDYHPFLLAGERLHLGKGASFGLGRYVLADPESL